jgi:hypothetical protein
MHNSHTSGTPTIRPTAAVASCGATYHVGTDRYPYTVIAIEARDRILAALDRLERGRFVRERFVGPTTFTLRTSGQWVREGQPDRGDGHLVLGTRDFYLDPLFG